MSSKQSPASQPCTVPCVGAFVCAVPAALPQVGMASPQPQMFMMAPMMAPMITQQYLQDFSFSPGYGSFTGAQYPWPADGAFQYFGAPNSGEEAPQQLPMEAVFSQGWSLETGGSQGWSEHNYFEYDPARHSEEEVPAQLQMDSTTTKPRSLEQGHSKSTTLRRRKGQECSAREVSAQGCDISPTGFSKSDAVQADPDAEAEARKIANGLLEQFEAGGDSQASALANFERLAFSSKTSSRAAQMILENASSTGAAAFAAGLRGHVRNAVQSKHANHVVQKITEVMPVARASFVVDELKGVGHDIVRHVFGCRVMCRILEHLSPDDLSTIQLVDEVLDKDLSELCNHNMGSYAVRHILEFGLPAHKKRVVSVLHTEIVAFAKNRFGSHVVEAALRHASHDDQKKLARELLLDKEHLMRLASDQFGRHVVRALLTMPGDLKREAAAALQPMQEQLKNNRFGKSVLQAVKAATTA